MSKVKNHTEAYRDAPGLHKANGRNGKRRVFYLGENAMVKIKMDDVFSIDADYEKMHISLFNKSGEVIYNIKCFSYFDISDTFSKLSKRFRETIDGKKILIVLPSDRESQTTKKDYKRGSLYMDFSVGKEL